MTCRLDYSYLKTGCQAGTFVKKGEERMSAIQPKGEKLRQAVKWISGSRQEDESRPILILIQEAAHQFNLSPKEEEFLRSFYRGGNPDCKG